MSSSNRYRGTPVNPMITMQRRMPTSLRCINQPGAKSTFPCWKTSVAVILNPACRHEHDFDSDASRISSRLCTALLHSSCDVSVNAHQKTWTELIYHTSMGQDAWKVPSHNMSMTVHQNCRRLDAAKVGICKILRETQVIPSRLPIWCDSTVLYIISHTSDVPGSGI